MPIRTDSSIVPDSTLSSSPSTPISPGIKRSAFTYGRRREFQPALDDPDSSATLAESTASLSSSHSSYRTTQFDFEEEVPPSSDALEAPTSSGVTLADDDAASLNLFASKTDLKMAVDGEIDGDINNNSPARSDGAEEPSFQFSWKKKLKQMDEDSDDPDQLMVPPTLLGHSNDLGLLCNDGLDVPVPLSKLPDSPKKIPPTSDDVFGGSLFHPRRPSPSHSPAFNASPAISPSSEVIKRRKKRAVVVDSDDELPGDDSSFNNSILKMPHPINTPRLQSSPTPPTSDMDLSVTKSQNKGKGKAAARDVPPLVFGPGSESSSEERPEKKSLNKSKTKRSRSKVKAPTKKELKETRIDQQRILADRKVQIERTEQAKQHTIGNLFKKLQDKHVSVNPVLQASAPAPPALPSSDPIQTFPSSPRGDDATATEAFGVLPADFGAPSSLLALPQPSRPQSTRRASEPLMAITRRTSTPAMLPALDDSDEEELPELSDLLAEDEKTRKAKQLAEIKRRALAEQQARLQAYSNVDADDDDDDELVVESNMHVVAEEEAEERRVRQAKHIRLSEGRKRQLMLGGIGCSKAADKNHHKETRHGRVKMNPLERLRESARPAFGGWAKHGKEETTAGLSPAELNRLMVERVEREKLETNKLKEEEWTRRGGKTLRDIGATEAKIEDLAVILEKGREAAEKVAQKEDEGESSDGSDEDWAPELRGSASPEPMEAGSSNEDEGVASEVEVAMNVQTDNEGDDSETDDKENSRPRPPRRSLIHRAVLDSDEEDDMENVRPLQGKASVGRILVPATSFVDEGSLPLSRMPSIMHRGSLSSFDEPTEDENDKENNTQLMFDKSEDKENKAVVRHSPLTSRSALGSRMSPLFRPDEGTSRRWSVSPPGANLGDDGHSQLGDITSKPRKPLKELVDDDDDPFAFSPSISSFASRLRRPDPSDSQLSLTSPPPVLDVANPQLEFSQFLGDENNEHPVAVGKPGLQPGFSEIFISGSEPSAMPFNASRGGGFSQWSEDQNDSESWLEKLREAPGDTDELSLTLDVGLKPALEVDENLRHQADLIFDKEQAFVVEAANRKPKNKPDLYVNDHGFLTQTRPDVSSPEIYRVNSPSQTQVASNIGTSKNYGSQSAQRHPLRTISVSDLLESPEDVPLKRLRRRSMSPAADVSNGGYRSTPSPSPTKKPSNIFDEMLRAQANKEKAEKKKLEKSEFVEAEAEESDDDDQFGFGKYRKNDEGEEQDGEEQDKTLEGLVDDAEMDDATMAADLVLEKVKEHQEEDDKAVEKIHRDAIEGKLRVKRRGMVGIEDSSDEEEDEADRHRRRQMAKRRKIDGDNLEELGAHPETKAFYDTYHGDLQDDNNEFAHMQSGDVVMGSNDEDGDPEAEEARESVSVWDIRDQLRSVAQRDESPKALNPHDVTWIDAEDEDENEGVKAVAVKAVSRQAQQPKQGQADIDTTFRQPIGSLSDELKTTLSNWAKGETRTKNIGTGRNTVSAAVTGHKAKAKAGGGSLRTTASSSTSAVATALRKPVKAPTMLAVVSDKSSRFGH